MNTFAMCNGTTNLLVKRNIYFMLYERLIGDAIKQFNYPFYYVDKETLDLIYAAHPEINIGESVQGVTDQPNPVSVELYPVSKKVVYPIAREQYSLMVFLNIKSMLLAAYSDYPNKLESIKAWTSHEVEPIEIYSADDLKSELQYFLSYEHYGSRYYPAELKEEIQKTYPFEEPLYELIKSL